MFYLLDNRNTKKNLKRWVFINNNHILVKLFQKKAKIPIYFFMKNSKNNNIMLDFTFMYLVSVYPTNRTIVLKIREKLIIEEMIWQKLLVLKTEIWYIPWKWEVE